MRTLVLDEADVRAAIERLGDFLIEYEASLADRPVLPDLDRAALLSILEEPIPASGRPVGELFDELEQVIVPNSTNVSHGRFLAYVLASPTNLGPIADAVAAALNQNCNLWTLSPAANAVEQCVIRWFAEWFKLTGGVLTSGGSTANLMGLVAARDAAVQTAPHRGIGAARLTMYTSTEAHRSVDKAAAIIGVGRDNVRRIPTETDHRLDVNALADAIREDRDAGARPFCVVATSGTVTTGAFDSIADIADVCADHDLWLHVDGAYGALAVLCEETRGALDGIDRADSLTLDPHKLLFMPLEAGCVLFRDEAQWRRSFADASSYLDMPDETHLVHYADYGIQLSRSFKALKIWWTIRAFGLDAVRTAITSQIHLAQEFAARIEAHPSFELAAPVTFTAVCFRIIRLDDNGHTAALHELLRSGRAFLGPVQVAGRPCLRACFVNLRTRTADLDVVLDELAAIASSDRV